MGSGSVALVWYALCLAFVSFVFVIGAGLVWFGQRRRARARAARLGRAAGTLAGDTTARAPRPAEADDAGAGARGSPRPLDPPHDR